MEQQVALSAADVTLIKNLIQIVSTRGAIKAEEMQVVGELYNRLSTFVDTTQPQTEENKGE